MLDLHLHSSWSGDAYCSVMEMCARAAEIRLTEIAFADHVDNNPRDVSFGRFDCHSILKDVEEARRTYGDRLSILMGAELAEPHTYPREMKELLSTCEFDMLIGSVHWVNGELISADIFDGKRMAELYDRYFDEVLAMARVADFDVLAHLDIAKRFGVKYLGPFSIEPFRDRIEAILRTIIERGIALEINTSGLRQPCADLFPCMEILRLYREMGGALVTVGSDAHRPEHVGLGFERAVRALREAGFDRLTTYRSRKPTCVPL